MTNNPLTAHITERIQSLLDAHKVGQPLPDVTDCFTDNFAEVLEKLMILTVRVWFFEDQMGEAHSRGDDAKIAEIKKKMDVLWKRKRPALVAAINRMVDDAIAHQRSLAEDSLKIYKGFEE